MKLFRPRFAQRHGTPDLALTPNPVRHYPSCACLEHKSGRWQELTLHSEIQNTESDAWKSLEAYIQKVDADGSDELNPIAGIGPEKWEQIVALPHSIGALQSVKVLGVYGSYKYRAPFPRLPSISADLTPACCSVCRGPFTKHGIFQAWVSLPVATDVLPLLVHACSSECLQKLPKPAEGYVPQPHQCGLEVKQPPTEEECCPDDRL